MTNRIKLYLGTPPSLRTAIWNVRFNLGYKIGGFTSAKRAR